MFAYPHSSSAFKNQHKSWGRCRLWISWSLWFGVARSSLSVICVLLVWLWLPCSRWTVRKWGLQWINAAAAAAAFKKGIHEQATSEMVSGQLICTDIYWQFLLTCRSGDLELMAKLAQSQSQQREEFLGRKAGLSFPNQSCLGELGGLLAPEKEEGGFAKCPFQV